MPIPNIRTVTTTLSIIDNQDEVNNPDDLIMPDGRKVLIAKGGSSQLLTNRIMKEFSERKDRAGNSFKLSRRFRWLTSTDPYGAPAKLTGPELEGFVLQWFCPFEHVHSFPPQTLATRHLSNCGPQSYLRLLDALPPFLAALVAQPRFMNDIIISWFQLID